ncbi:MAG: phospholipase D-like domain-containing protein [Deltaproteobacteria bacterium]|nr:phospholipase D-like domain-containing protein [Deltaproteobacteria bacterium]
MAKVLDQLHELMNGAAEIDIEPGYFTLSGWYMLIESEKIPREAKIRIIAGKDHVISTKPELDIQQLISALKINRNLETHQFALRDMARRIFGRGPYLPNLEIKAHWDNHRKIYIAREKQWLLKPHSQILVGSANLSENGLTQRSEIYNEGVWSVHRREVHRIEREFEHNWGLSRKVDTRRFLKALRYYITPEGDWRLSRKVSTRRFLRISRDYITPKGEE